MRVVTYTRGAGPRAGLLVEDTVYDAETSASFFRAASLPADLGAILEGGGGPALRDLDTRIRDARHSGADLPLTCWAGIGEIRLAAPLARPPKIMCLGLNYRDHAEEQGAKLPETPLIFAKLPSSVIGPGQPIVIPREFDRVDYEGELALVIGRRIRRATPEQALEAVFGYTILNDVTERALQNRERFWLEAKGSDTFAPMGPWIVTGDELGDPLNLKITTSVNSRVVQSSSTANLVFTPARIIARLSEHITLEPGDVISTGTPGGVGVFRKPPVFLKAGDTVEVTIEGIGTLASPVVREA
ncbi:MAG: fumarylacetoacetate hydrolase family protein [bacterium]